MRYSVGCDITQIARIEKAAGRQSFCRRAFSPQELERFSQMSSPYASMAGAWAAKEALSKALRTGVRGFSLNEITVAHDSLGAPYFVLTGSAAEAAAGLELSLSISHEGEYALAFCIAYKADNR